MLSIEEIFFIVSGAVITVVGFFLTWALLSVLSILRNFERAINEMHEKIHRVAEILEYFPKHAGLILAGITELISFFKNRNQKNKGPSNFHPEYLDKEE